MRTCSSRASSSGNHEDEPHPPAVEGQVPDGPLRARADRCGSSGWAPSTAGALVDVDVGGRVGDRGNELEAGGAGADHGNTPTGQVDTIGPCRRQGTPRRQSRWLPLMFGTTGLANWLTAQISARAARVSVPPSAQRTVTRHPGTVVPPRLR